MTNNNLQIIVAGIAALAATTSVFLEIFVSRKHSKEINRCLEICNGIVIEEIKIYMKVIIKHFNDELNRIVEVIISRKVNENESSLIYDQIDKFEIKDLDENSINTFNVNSYKKIKNANLFIKKLEYAACRLKIFRWIFVFLYAFILLIGISVIGFKNIIFTWILITLVIVSVILLILYVINTAIMNELINDTEKEYAISI